MSYVAYFIVRIGQEAGGMFTGLVVIVLAGVSLIFFIIAFSWSVYYGIIRRAFKRLMGRTLADEMPLDLAWAAVLATLLGLLLSGLILFVGISMVDSAEKKKIEHRKSPHEVKTVMPENLDWPKH